MKTHADSYIEAVHTFGPVFDADSHILILGSFPSVKSREQGFYYGHPQNRFWRVMAQVLQCNLPQTVEEKTSMLLEHHVALWDVVERCELIGSSDSSIRNVEPVNLQMLLEHSNVHTLFANGKTAGRLYQTLIQPSTGMEITILPSTSPANAAFTFERLVEIWESRIGHTWES